MGATAHDDHSAGPGDDWPAQVADRIEEVVGKVRDTTTGPAITAARALVYGLVAGIVGVAVIVLAAVAAVRFLDAYLPDDLVGEDHTWAAHLVVGVAFSAAGGLLWARRTSGNTP